MGVLQALEIDIDGSFTLEDTPGQPRSFDQVSNDNLWLSSKFSLVEIDETAESWGVGFGLQLGPKLPTAPDSYGVGVESLALIALIYGPTQIAFNAGGYVDPPVDPTGRPMAFETGISLSRDIDASGDWSVTGQVGATHFFSDDPDQLTFTVGVAYDPTRWLELSVTGLAGTLAGGDRYGIVIGFTPKFRLWN